MKAVWYMRQGAATEVLQFGEQPTPHAKAGADAIVNYKTEDVAARVREFTRGAGADHAVEVDFGGNLAAPCR